MNNNILVVAVAAALCTGASADAASGDELAEVREQLQSLMQRVERLEQDNAALKAQNEDLQGKIAKTPLESSDAVPAEPVGKVVEKRSGEPRSLAESGWPDRITLKGDLRYRHQQSDDARALAEREEHLLRARLSLEARANDDLMVGIGLSTADGGNPRGANVRLDGAFSRKSLDLDLGYLDWRIAEGAHAIAGKMRKPFVRPGQSLFWDNDVNPEGVALTYSRGPWFASAYGFWIDENVQYTITPNAATDTTDTKMYGAQLGGRFDLGASNLAVAAMYYDLAAAQDRRPFFNNSGNGNSLNATGGLLFDYQVMTLMAEYNAKLAALPLQVWLDLAQNTDAELDMAVGFGVLLGKAARPGSWEAGLAYQILEKDALFAQHIDSDFAGGLSDSEGWVLRAAYAPLKNWALNATWFMTRGNVDVGDEFDYDRLLLDINVKF